jgi:hypothetical protein
LDGRNQLSSISASPQTQIKTPTSANKPDSSQPRPKINLISATQVTLGEQMGHANRPQPPKKTEKFLFFKASLKYLTPLFRYIVFLGLL